MPDDGECLWDYMAASGVEPQLRQLRALSHKQLVAIVSTDGVANAGGTTWVRGSNPRGSTIWGHSSGVEQCFPNSCRHISAPENE